jgi:hypothetical protein
MASNDRWERIALQFTPEQYEYLRQRGFDRRMSIAALVRELVEAQRIADNPQVQLPLPLPFRRVIR